jgi:hypothetical protein
MSSGRPLRTSAFHSIGSCGAESDLSNNRLGGREISAMIERVTGNKTLPESIRQDIMERTDARPDRQPDPRPVLYGLGEQLTSPVEIVAGVKEALDLRAVLGPLSDLVEIAIVRALSLSQAISRAHRRACR